MTLLAHITDAHLTRRGKRTAVLKDLAVPILDDLATQLLARGVDAALFGGDNIDNRGAGEDDLALFLEYAARFPRWLATVGNHEATNPEAMGRRISKDRFARAVAGHGIEGPEQLDFSTVVGDVRVIGIDTTLVGTHGGHVTDRTLRFLARELARADEPHVVVLGHHLIAAPWAPYRLDAWDREYLVSNRDVVVALLATQPRVRAYLCGHHHGSRIQRIAGRGDSAGFYHVVTPSPVAYPHGVRVLDFGPTAMTVETLVPTLPGVMELGRAAVETGRKAERFATLGTQRAFHDYVRGRDSDNDVILPYAGPPSPRASSNVERRATAETLSASA